MYLYEFKNISVVKELKSPWASLLCASHPVSPKLLTFTCPNQPTDHLRPLRYILLLHSSTHLFLKTDQLTGPTARESYPLAPELPTMHCNASRSVPSKRFQILSQNPLRNYQKVPKSTDDYQRTYHQTKTS